MNINVFLLFFSFVFLQIEREREWYIKLGIRRYSPKVTYLIFRRGSTGESFFFYGLIDFMLFLTLAWRKWLLRVSHNFFVFFYPEYLAFGYVSYEPCPKTNFLTINFRWREGVPTSVLGCQPIIWLLSSSSWSGDFFRATRCHPSPILFPSGHPVQTSVFPFWTGFVTLGLTYILSCLNGHSLAACHC